MPTLAIDKGFLTDLPKLDTPVAKRVTDVFDEFDSATPTERHLERTARTVQDGYFTVERDDDGEAGKAGETAADSTVYRIIAPTASA